MRVLELLCLLLFQAETQKKTLWLSQHVCKACGQVIPQQRTFQHRQLRTKNLKTLELTYETIKPITLFI